jgi:hypothetical protein
MKWYYSDAGQQIGPIDDAAFQALVNRGVIRDDTQVWREGMAGWAPYSTVKPAVPVAPVAPAYVPPPAAAPIPPAAQQAQFMPPAAAAAVAKAEASGMFFFYPVLKALNDGRIIRRGVIIFLQILAVLSVLGGLFLLVTSLSGATLRSSSPWWSCWPQCSALRRSSGTVPLPFAIWRPTRKTLLAQNSQ